MSPVPRFILPALLGSSIVTGAYAMPVNVFSFTIIAEINPLWSALGSCLIAAILILRHSAKFRK